MQQNIEELLGMMDQGKNPFDGVWGDQWSSTPVGGGRMQMPSNILGVGIGAIPQSGGTLSQPQIGPDGKPISSQTERGQNPGISKYITEAMGVMQNMIAESTDPQEIAAIRMVISILTRLMEREQAVQSQKLSQ